LSEQKCDRNANGERAGQIVTIVTPAHGTYISYNVGSMGIVVIITGFLH
jgi:hypothetical protein